MTNDEFSDVEIDISQELLESLILTVDRFLLENIKSCSYAIWEQERGYISNIPTLNQLFGDCLVNDLIVEAIEAGIQIAARKEAL